MRPLSPLHSWHLVDASPGAAGDAATLEAAFTRGQATLTYGERCFEFTNTVEAGGECSLRLEEVGRVTAGGSGKSLLVFSQDGYRAEERIAPCRDALDGALLRDIDVQVLQALARALLDDAARAMDVEEGLR